MSPDRPRQTSEEQDVNSRPTPDTLREARSPAEWTIPELRRWEAPVWLQVATAAVAFVVPSVVLQVAVGRGVHWLAIAFNAGVVLVALAWVAITARSARACRLEAWLAEVGRTDPEGWREAAAFDEQRRQTAAEQRVLGR
jgi:hypothetical protein